ncbi:hypothetical protein G9A89_015872 [Geosiphon pyriformis]|nr:hypothetical protein G9A89_015872 [Geosiphon pyriformis]
MYTDAKVDGHAIKLILNSRSADSIIIKQLMDQLSHQVDCAASTKIITANGVTKTLIGEIDNFLIEVIGITVSIKVLVMKTTQYQALVGNNCLSKTNVTLDWTTQELQISQNSQYTRVPAMCGYFKPSIETSTLQQPNSTAAHVSLNALEDQNKLENGTINHAWLVKKLFQTKECEITFLDKEKHAMKYEQKLRRYSNNNEGIIPEHVHDTDVGFDLKYPEKNPIKLEPHSCTCIDLKIVLKIPATTMVQLAFRSNLAKKGINIRGGIIDTRYIENIIVMLQNDSEKAYTINPNKKIIQAIFISLVKVAQLVSMRNSKELGITGRRI